MQVRSLTEKSRVGPWLRRSNQTWQLKLTDGHRMSAKVSAPEQRSAIVAPKCAGETDLRCYRFRDCATGRGGGTRARDIDMGALFRSHGRAVGRPGAPSRHTPERHDHAICL